MNTSTPNFDYYSQPEPLSAMEYQNLILELQTEDVYAAAYAASIQHFRRTLGNALRGGHEHTVCLLGMKITGTREQIIEVVMRVFLDSCPTVQGELTQGIQEYRRSKRFPRLR